MGYAVAAWVMLAIIFTLWGFAIFGPASEDAEMQRYREEREAFERMFE